MRALIPVVGLGFMACKAPERVQLADSAVPLASIEIVHPVTGSMALDDHCELLLIVAADIDNFQLVTPNIPGVTDADVDGQGHWHLTFGEDDYVAVDDGLHEELLLGLSVGTELAITGALQTNTHEDVKSPEAKASVAIIIEDNAAGSCD
jgi:hypothetical protein